MRLIKEVKGNDIISYYDSSNLLKSVYNVDKKELLITFNSSHVYKYDDVNEAEYLIFDSSESQGKTFAKFIKNKKNVKIGTDNVSEIRKIIIDKIRNNG